MRVKTSTINWPFHHQTFGWSLNTTFELKGRVFTHNPKRHSCRIARYLYTESLFLRVTKNQKKTENPQPAESNYQFLFLKNRWCPVQIWLCQPKNLCTWRFFVTFLRWWKRDFQRSGAICHFESLGILCPQGSNHLLRTVMEPNILPEEVIEHPNHYLRIWLDA